MVCKQTSQEAIHGKLICKNMFHRFEGNILRVQNRFGGMQDHSSFDKQDMGSAFFLALAGYIWAMRSGFKYSTLQDTGYEIKMWNGPVKVKLRFFAPSTGIAEVAKH